MHDSLMARHAAGVMVLAAFTIAACGSVAAPAESVACVPVARFRLDGIDYEVQTNRDVVASDDVGELVAENLGQPPEIKECVPFFELKDGETSLVSGTDVYTIKGVDPSDALTASDNGSEQNPRYMRFVALP
jgi:hypothetical protein